MKRYRHTRREKKSPTRIIGGAPKYIVDCNSKNPDGHRGFLKTSYKQRSHSASRFSSKKPFFFVAQTNSHFYKSPGQKGDEK